jgi:hypothetical protein
VIKAESEMALPFWYPLHMVVQAFWQKAVLPAMELANGLTQKVAKCEPSMQFWGNFPRF